MMRYKIIILCVFCIINTTAFSQKIKPYKTKLQVETAAGGSLALTKLFTGNASDHLISYAENAFYFQLAVSYFFHRHWGTELNFRYMYDRSMSGRQGKFTDAMNARYGNNYFVLRPNAILTDEVGSSNGIERGVLGIVYRYEKNRLFIHPKLSFGICSFYTDYDNVYLKEKNANAVIGITYKPNKHPQDHFIVSPAVSVGYKPWKRYFFSLDIAGSYFKTNFAYNEEIKDMNTGQINNTKFEYKKNIFNLSVGAGLIVRIL